MIQLTEIVNDDAGSKRQKGVMRGVKKEKSTLSIAALEGAGSFIDTGSSNYVFIFEYTDALSIEDAESLLVPASLPYPLAAVHESRDFTPIIVTDLLEPVPDFEKVGEDLELRSTRKVVLAPEEQTKLGEEVMKVDDTVNINPVSIEETTSDSE
jgi:hypothetical protein